MIDINGIASHYLPNKTNQNTRIFVGSYDFHLIKNGEDWQIYKFKFNFEKNFKLNICLTILLFPFFIPNISYYSMV
jgi:hypothetical protein